MKVSTFMWVALTVAIGVSMFLLKYKVQALEEELVAKQEQITRDQDALRVLEAEWAYFNDPERLRRLSVEHLDFGQPSPDRVKIITTLPFRESLTPLPKNYENDVVPLMQSASKTPARVRPNQIRTETAPKNLSVGPVILARIQRYLTLDRTGAPSVSGGAP
jgi:hypothetical protein